MNTKIRILHVPKKNILNLNVFLAENIYITKEHHLSISIWWTVLNRSICTSLAPNQLYKN